MEKEELDFGNWKPIIMCANDPESVIPAQKHLFNYISQLNKNSNHTSSNDDLSFILSQLNSIIADVFKEYEKEKEIPLLSVQLMKHFAQTYARVLNLMMLGAHDKFSLNLLDIVNKFNDIILLNVKKLSMKNNWYSTTKHFAAVVLQAIFTKFSGFLNNFKQPLITALYKHLKKCNENYNSALENQIFKANYYSDMVFLINIIILHDNSNKTIDDKLFERLLKLTKVIREKNKSTDSTSSVYSFPIVSVLYSFNILVALLKSDRYTLSLAAKKTSFTSSYYLTSLSSYINIIIDSLDTDHKKLRLSLSKNLSDILVFAYSNFVSLDTQQNQSLDACINILMLNYRKEHTPISIKIGIIETLMQWLSKLNLYYQSSTISAESANGVNFVATKFFDLLNLFYFHLFGMGSIDNTSFKKQLKENNFIDLNNLSSPDIALKTINHLNIIYKFLIDLLDNDVNKLIIVSKLALNVSANGDNDLKIKTLTDMIPSRTADIHNIWYTISLLHFSQLLIDNLGEYILSMQDGSHEEVASGLASQFSEFSLNKNFRIRVVAIESLVKVIKLKPELSFNILNVSIESLAESLSDMSNNAMQVSFNENHGNAYLISSILSFGSKNYITNDIILRTFSLSFNFLKKFNTTVVSTNLFGSASGSYISNVDYEKQLISWILMMGLFNYSISGGNAFLLQDSAQFLSIWKNLLGHSIPTGFVQVENNKIANIPEIIKLVEVKNHALVGLTTYITHLLSSERNTEYMQTCLLLTPEMARNINQLLAKSFIFINTLLNEVEKFNIPESLKLTMNINKLRVYESYLKLLPYLNIKNEINSTMLIEIVKNFSSIDLFRPLLKDMMFLNMKKKRISMFNNEYDIYRIEDEFQFGITSKFDGFSIDELMLKLTESPEMKNSITDIDHKQGHSNFIVESREIDSFNSPISIFDSTIDNRKSNFYTHSLLNDSLMFLLNGTESFGYTNTMKYCPNYHTMIIDTSVEIFAITFPYLSSKIQQSVIETIRTNIFFQVKESIESEDVEQIKVNRSLTLRRKAVGINCSVAIHSMLSYMINSDLQLKLKPEIATLVLETLKNINIEDGYLRYLNSQSFGMGCSLIESENQAANANNQISILINSIIESSKPNSRSFEIISLGNLAKYTRMKTANRIESTIFTLLLDPHPLVHAGSLYALDKFLVYQDSIDYQLTEKVIDRLEDVLLNETYGIDSQTTISSNINFREYLNSSILLVKIIRTIINITGPMIKLWEPKLKNKIKNILTCVLHTISYDYEVIIREILKIYESLIVFDKSMVLIPQYEELLKKLLTNNIYVGVYGHSSFNQSKSDSEIFPNNTSSLLLKLSLESFHQLIKINVGDFELAKEFESLLWILLERNGGDPTIRNIHSILLNDIIKGLDSKKKIESINKLLMYFSISKNQLYEPLKRIFNRRITTAGLLTGSKTMTLDKLKNKSSNEKNIDAHGLNNDDDLNEAEETLASSTNDDNSFRRKADDIDTDDHDTSRSNNNKDATTAQAPIDSLIKILDTKDEQTNWKFKTYLVELMNDIMSQCEHDETLKNIVLKRLNEFIRVSFISSTSNLIELRISSLKLLNQIITIFEGVMDPLYPEIPILEQQHAQIVSAIIPSFNKNSTLELAGEGILLSSKLICCNVNNIGRMNRIIRILTTSLENLAVINKLGNYEEESVQNREIGELEKNEEGEECVKIGELPILTKKSMNKMKVYILQSWSKMIILNAKNHDNAELQTLIDRYIDILIPLWLYILREFVILKYTKLDNYNTDNSVNKSYRDKSNDSENKGLDLEMYQSCQIDLIESIGIIIGNEEWNNKMTVLLGDELGKMFLMIFSECTEYLIKRIPKTNSNLHQNLRVMETLRRIMNIDISIDILLNESIFIEFIDMINKLILVCDGEELIEINYILKEIFNQYFKRLNEENKNEMKKQFDKLFEMIRLIIKIIVKKLPFIKNKEILFEEDAYQLNGEDMIIIKRCFSSIIEMTEQLPSAIEEDIYIDMLFMLVLIYQYNDENLISILLPIYQKVINNYHLISNNEKNETTLLNLYQIMKIRTNNELNDQLLTFIIIKTVPEINVKEKDIGNINLTILNGLKSNDNNLISISIQTLKALIKNINNKNQISIKLFNKLIKLLIKDIDELKEPRIVIEILINLLKYVDSSKIKSLYELLIPLIVSFNEKLEVYDDYVKQKMVELISLDSELFKEIISKCDEGLKIKVELIIKNDKSNQTSQMKNEKEHIELKDFV